MALSLSPGAQAGVGASVAVAVVLVFLVGLYFRRRQHLWKQNRDIAISPRVEIPFTSGSCSEGALEISPPLCDWNEEIPDLEASFSRVRLAGRPTATRVSRHAHGPEVSIISNYRPRHACSKQSDIEHHEGHELNEPSSFSLCPSSSSSPPLYMEMAERRVGVSLQKARTLNSTKSVKGVIPSRIQ